MADYKPDRRGLREIGMSSGVQQASVEAAERGKAYAEAMAPRDSGTFARSFRVRPETVNAGRSNEPRAGAVLENTAPYARYVRSKGDSFMYNLVPIIEGRGR